MMIIKHVVIGTDTWLVSFPEPLELDDDEPFSLAAPSPVFGLLDDDVTELWSSSDMKLSCKRFENDVERKCARPRGDNYVVEVIDVPRQGADSPPRAVGSALGDARTDAAEADLRVDPAERLGEHVADVREVQQEERHADDRVNHRHDLPLVRVRRRDAVADRRDHRQRVQKPRRHAPRVHDRRVERARPSLLHGANNLLLIPENLLFDSTNAARILSISDRADVQQSNGIKNDRPLTALTTSRNACFRTKRSPSIKPHFSIRVNKQNVNRAETDTHRSMYLCGSKLFAFSVIRHNRSVKLPR